jgi:endoribonuclease Dicer
MARNFWVDVDYPPKCLPDVVEAYVGAIFVDSGYDYGIVSAFFYQHIAPWFEDMSIYDDFARRHPVTRLAKHMRHDFGCGEWRLLVNEVPVGEEDGAAVMTQSKVVCGFLVHGTVRELGVSTGGRHAKAAAATKALEKFDKMTREQFREQWGCNCELMASEEPTKGPVSEYATAV